MNTIDRLPAFRDKFRASRFDGVVARLARPLSRLRLRHQLALLVLATALPLVLSTLFMFNRLASNEREAVRQNLLVGAKTLAALVDTEIASHAAIGATLSHSTRLVSGDLEAFWQQAKQSLEFVPGAWLSLSNADGQMLLNTLVPYGTPLPRRLDNETAKRAFASRRPELSDLAFGPVSQRQAARIEIPIFKNDEPLYTISIGLSTDRFYKMISERFTRDEVIGILDRTKRFVARLPDHHARVATLASDGWRAGIAKSPEGWTENISLDGHLIINAYTQTGFGWTVGVAQLASAIETPARGILVSTAALWGVLVSLSLLVGFFLARRASQGMAALATAAANLGEGRDFALPPSPFIEAETISLALQRASSELRTRDQMVARAQADLEAKVAERTSELTAEMQRRIESEGRMRQMQKMEAVGQLSGGIAHDFNNMLAIVLGGLRLLERNLARGERDVSKFTDAIRQGAERAAVLTQRLLAFARQQPLSPAPTDANKLVRNISELLRRTIPESIAIETVLAGGLWRINVDNGELENAILNLAANGRDAMPEGGKLTIETANTHLDDAYAGAERDVTPGQYVLIAVTDTGPGMTPDVLEKAFEPFFTTKPSGQGTGLGLAQVYGFIKQSGGHVKLYNEPGHGVSVKLYLPRHLGDERATRQASGEASTPLAPNGETILVVEDEAAVLDLTVGMLQELGYRTIAAQSGARALEQLRQHPEVALLLTDVVMPGMNGRKLADAALAERPGLRVLFATGYTRNAIVHNGVVDADVELITKPYTLEALAQKVHRVLLG